MRLAVARGVLIGAGLAWVGGLGLGVHQLSRYEGTAGATKPSLDSWPANAPERNSGGFTLAVFVHPKCPCSQATVSSLDKIMARCGGKAKAYVFAALPDGAPAEWKASALLAKARGVAGVRVIEDDKGAYARQFGAMTSGQTLLFDASGARVFAGGITDGRGHEGPNAGMQGVEAILVGRGCCAPDTPVFGCSLLGE